MPSSDFIPDEKMHAGHRSRMRDKLLEHGPGIFDTYELLEMLLYYSIPYRDTNPIAKRLLAEFGSLEGVLRAPAERLIGSFGIGERTAELIRAAGAVRNALFLDSVGVATVYNDYHTAGMRFVEYFAGCRTRAVAMLMLDNGMRERGIVTLYDDVTYATAAVKAPPFIKAALAANASVVITAQNYPRGLYARNEGDEATSTAIEQSFAKLGIAVAEHYVITGDTYVGTRRPRPLALSADTELDRFWKSKERAISNGKVGNI